MLKLNNLKEKYVGKTLKSIISVDVNSEIIDRFKKITEGYGDGIDNIKILLFENNQYLAFVDFDCDGYRSGDWYVVDLKNWLDTGGTKDIKNINSKVRDIQYYERCSKEYLLISTEEYIIEMGQENIDDYYPHNFFNIQELKETIKEGKIVEGRIDGEVVSFKED